MSPTPDEIARQIAKLEAELEFGLAARQATVDQDVRVPRARDCRVEMVDQHEDARHLGALALAEIARST